MGRHPSPASTKPASNLHARSVARLLARTVSAVISDDLITHLSHAPLHKLAKKKKKKKKKRSNLSQSLSLSLSLSVDGTRYHASTHSHRSPVI